LDKKNVPKLSNANFEIMKFVWSKDEVSINEVLEAINAKRKEKVKRASIQVQLRRLEKYGWIKHKKVNRTFYYKALRGQEKATKDILKDIRNRVFNGSNLALVKCLFDETNFTVDELDRITDLLDNKKRISND
jgi:BlaI family penicillinase repressor